MPFSRRIITQPVGGEPPIETDFVLTVETTETDEIFTLTCQSVGAYNAQIDWGDGSPVSQIDTYDDPDLIHTYANPGTHTIRITGVFSGVYFYNTVESLKVKTVESWGDIIFERFRNAFYGCSNFTKAGDGVIGYENNYNNVVRIFSGTSIITLPSGIFDQFNSVTDFSDGFNGCFDLISLPNGLFDYIPANINFLRCFLGCSSLVALPSGLFDGVTDPGANFDASFRNCTSLTTIPADIFKFVGSNKFTNSFNNCALTQQSVDNILVSLDESGVQNGRIDVNGGTSSAPGSAGLTAKANLEGKGWTVNTN